MALKLHNTLSKKKEVFKPLKGKQVRIYVCGPTVNDVPHLGHARQQISFDVLRRYLKHLGYKVKFVSNITDIEDKIINKSEELGVSIKELTSKNYKEHMEDYSRIGIDKPDVQPYATKYVKQMIELIKKLEKKGYTYVFEGDGVYYDISKFKNYGKLSGQKLEDLKTSKRIKGKKNKDFVLWKFSKEGEPKWKSPWGDGRPGWHIECSAMSEAILGLPLDIHGGGQDLIFPHHEDEIAQSEAGFGKKFAKYWIHNGMVNVDKVKMSKSLGNFKTIKDLLKDYSGEVIRYFVLSTHYRKPIDFSKEKLDAAKESLKRLKNLISEIKGTGKFNNASLKEFEKSMNEDLNTPNAIQVLWSLVKDKKIKEGNKKATIKKMDEVLGLKLLEQVNIEMPTDVEELVKEREVARAKKDWKKADDLREIIRKEGYEVDDLPDGKTKVKLI